MNTFVELLNLLSSEQIKNNGSLLYDIIRMRQQIDTMELEKRLTVKSEPRKSVINLIDAKLALAYDDYQNLIRLIK
jgi:hypothetical protein